MHIQKPYLVGITGGSAMGKTHFLNSLKKLFSTDELCVISQDNYYKLSYEHQLDAEGNINFDLPECIDLAAFPLSVVSPIATAGQTGVLSGNGVSGSNFNPATAGAGRACALGHQHPAVEGLCIARPEPRHAGRKSLCRARRCQSAT